MANSSGLNRSRVLSRVTVAAITAALVSTTTAAVAADAPSASFGAEQKASNASAFSAASTAAATPRNFLYGVNSAGTIWGYQPVGGGTIQRLADNSGTGWNSHKHFSQADMDGDGGSDGFYAVRNGRLNYAEVGAPRDLGGGWGAYNKIISAANTGGGVADDLLARDSSGVLWHYLGYGNGGLTQRYRVGSGWNAYTQIAGKGDVSGDGRADVVARDRSGVLWLYKGTGNYKSPFTTRTRIGSGWNGYNLIASSGDLNFDSRADLVARDSAGALWLYKGTGNPSSPYTGRVKIGTSGWNGFREIF
ncbi:VCBS repeat-containing protein [Streptomyces sp. NBC_00572]|uniref:FG-GAP repeat domain-containing protein n=1 Tax=Streptomyces sp. NBC_00572 TaxID=2903664 RepID=UPI0022598E93|nr:VCBS repeat-containing protein [Streptomyces sp. NBC_00572]MCX4984134.1 VCBS repeat-containing protein [Streptomyces sp. NBC_00572]